MGELFWNYTLNGYYQNDFVVQVIVWLHGICYAEKYGYHKIHLKPFQNKVFADFFKNTPLVFHDCFNIDDHTIYHSISSLTDVKQYRTLLSDEDFLLSIYDKLRQIELQDHISDILGTFDERSVCVIDTRKCPSQSLKVNMACDPELNKYAILRRIPPGNRTLVYHYPDQQTLVQFNDVYNIIQLDVESDAIKQCIELFLLITNKVNFYYCSCISYSSKTYLIF